jgi:hypothetical protein
MSYPPATQRPGGVTTVAVLVYINGALDVVIGTLILLAAAFDNLESANAAWYTGFGAMFVGLIVIAVASGLLGGSNGARILVTIVQAFSLLANTIVLFAGGATFVPALISILISLLILGLLYTGRASAFFSSNSGSGFS